MSVRCSLVFISFSLLANGLEIVKEDVDNVIEEEITRKLGEDLLQSIERKFQVDLERSVDLALTKIKLLLQNGTQHLEDKLLSIQDSLDLMRAHAGDKVDVCLNQKQNQTSSLAEKALHQMVVCGYALIGQDPAQAVSKVVTLKNMIKMEVKPLYEQKKDIYNLLKVCGHQHDALKKVIKCVISKSSQIKSTMMGITEKLISGVVDLTKLVAHGAMHEACLIEVTKATEDESLNILNEVQSCVFANDTELQDFITNNNATVLDIMNLKTKNDDSNVKQIKNVITGMMKDKSDLNREVKEKLYALQKELNVGETKDNIVDVTNDINNVM